jgi:hypothetical protein
VLPPKLKMAGRALAVRPIAGYYAAGLAHAHQVKAAGDYSPFV